MKAIDLTKVLKGKTGWVSIAPNHKKIIAQARTLKALVEKLKRMGNPEGYITNVGRDYSTYIG